MSSFVEEFFDSFPSEFIDDAFLSYDYPSHALDDDNCILDEDVMDWSAPASDKWDDWLSSDHPATITMDSAKAAQWKLAKDEVRQVKTSFCRYLFENGDSSMEDIGEDYTPTIEEIVNVIIGPQSECGEFLMKELNLDEETYLRFFCTFCIQSAYQVSVAQLFHTDSLLKEHATMKKDEYVKVWETMATKRRLHDSNISNSRRQVPIWQKFEGKVNDVLREITVTDRTGKISIALDDDKIWLNLKSAPMQDLFNLKFSRHVKPNRNGLTCHTAVTSSILFPMGACFERAKDTTLGCFTRLLNSMFGQGGEQANLRNVHIHSDRGYMLPAVVFEFLLNAGAELVGTIKRMSYCWPFTYKQKLREGDKRTLIDLKGAPTLFLKCCKSGNQRAKRLFASAFRNGTDNAAMALSTLHDHHQWEGVIQDPSELLRYEADKTSLQGDFFKWVDLSFDQNELNDYDGMSSLLYPSEPNFFVKEIMESFTNETIDMCTLRQGEFNCHLR